MIYPYNAKTIETTIAGNTEQILVLGTNPKIILGVYVQQSGTASETLLLCGTQVFAKNYSKDFSLNLTYRECNDVIKAEKTGQDEAFISLTYYEGYLPIALVEHPTSTLGNFKIDKTFTYGDITEILLIGLFGFIGLFYILKKLFFHDEVAIHSIHKKVF